VGGHSSGSQTGGVRGGAGSAAGTGAGGGSGLVVQDLKRFDLYMSSLQQIISFLFLSVISTGPFSSPPPTTPGGGKEESSSPEDRVMLTVSADEVAERLPMSASLLFDLSVVVGDAGHLARLISRYERLEFGKNNVNNNIVTVGYV